MASDVTDHAKTSITTTRNYTVVVGAPKGSTTDAYGSNYTINSTINDAANLDTLFDKLGNRFDDPRYYNGDNS